MLTMLAQLCILTVAQATGAEGSSSQGDSLAAGGSADPLESQARVLGDDTAARRDSVYASADGGGPTPDVMLSLLLDQQARGSDDVPADSLESRADRVEGLKRLWWQSGRRGRWGGRASVYAADPDAMPVIIPDTSGLSMPTISPEGRSPMPIVRPGSRGSAAHGMQDSGLSQP